MDALSREGDGITIGPDGGLEELNIVRQSAPINITVMGAPAASTDTKSLISFKSCSTSNEDCANSPGDRSDREGTVDLRDGNADESSPPVPSLGSSLIMKSIADSRNLHEMISGALLRVGAGDLEECKQKARSIEEGLATLYIRTTDQLREALEAPEILAQITSSEVGIRGLLLSAIRDELKRDSVRSAWKDTSRKGTEKCKNKPMNKPLLRTLDVIRVDVTNVADLDQINQTFFARVFLILRIKNGALDNDLTKDFEGFPFDEDGRPTFRPSAKWYLNQIDFPNGRDIHTIDSKVTTEGNNLQLIKRVEGRFCEKFELHDLPYDQQDLTVTISLNCATEGPVPVEFRTHFEDEPPAQLRVDTVNFAQSDIWDLSPRLRSNVTTVGASSARRFPAVHLSANVQRKSQFLLINAAMPCSWIAFLSLTTFFVPVEDTADRLELTITILLTAVAFRFTTNSYLPMISYMTLIDKFTLLCTLVIVICCFCHTILGMLTNWAEASAELVDSVNKIFLGCIALIWGAVQVWFFCEQRIVSNRNFALHEKFSEDASVASDRNSAARQKFMQRAASNCNFALYDKLNEDGSDDNQNKENEKVEEQNNKERVGTRRPPRKNSNSLEKQSVTLWKRTSSVPLELASGRN